MPSSSISALSLENIKVQVITENNQDPTADTVQIAIPIKGANPTHWGTASWVTTGGLYYAKMLVGPGSPFGPLSVGKHTVWVKVSDNPAVPVLKSPDTLTVF